MPSSPDQWAWSVSQVRMSFIRRPSATRCQGVISRVMPDDHQVEQDGQQDARDDADHDRVSEVAPEPVGEEGTRAGARR